VNSQMDVIPTAEDELAAQIEQSTDNSPVSTTLRTDERVLARVTDGIYRQPGSAIRELVSNAYDADAQRVVIKTDRPRFHTISIEDDGIGMTPATLAHLLHHIGGSAKQTHEGTQLGITDHVDSSRSPSGRRLIGKIGIGLFSVAQLTHRFQIITKTVNDPWRTIASVVLRQYSEESAPQTDEQREYEVGKVTIWREPVADVDSHGTTIILTDIRHQARDALQSRDIWTAIDSDLALTPEDARDLKPPEFHIGRVQQNNSNILEGEDGNYDTLPWTSDDEPNTAFRKLVRAVWQQVDRGIPNPKLEDIFDYYLRMVWQLSLAIPAPYVFGNPFELPLNNRMSLFELPKVAEETPVEFTLADQETVAATRSIGSSAKIGTDFHVLFDDLKLTRPLKFTDLPATTHAVKKPILAVGHVLEEFDGVPAEFSGGPLEFDAYLIWAPKIAPTEHQGVLVRVHGSSGTLFDSTFMRYQVSEQTRLRQITCELFISTGFEAALNIDRESFNYAHPHVIYITKWLHMALRRLATIQKRIAVDIRRESRKVAADEQEEMLKRVIVEAWQNESEDQGAEPPSVEFEDAEDQLTPVKPGTYRFRRSPIFGESEGQRTRRNDSMEQKLRAIIQLLDAFEILQNLTGQQQERLLSCIREILEIAP